MDKATVIGGSGFLGSHVADELTRRGYAVTVFDRIPSPWIGDTQNMIVGNMLDRDALENACDGVRYLYHFGGIADIGEAKTRPFETIEANVLGVAMVLEAARAADVERFLSMFGCLFLVALI